MKKYILNATLIVAILATSSCGFLDYDKNIDPNKPADVSMKQLLPSIQISLAYFQGGDLARYLSCWTQHHSGVDRQHLAIEVYQITESDVNNYWGNMYATTLHDTKALLEKAAETGSPHYAGVGRVLWALGFSHIVDVFDDVSYEDALRGEESLQPSIQDAADIYNKLIAELDQAVIDLKATSSTLSPTAADDVIYKGDLRKWEKLAISLKARLQLHRSKIDNGAYAAVLSTLSTGAMAGNADNAMVNFGSSTTTGNPWFQFEDQRGDVVMGGFFIDLLDTLDDPRLPKFASLNPDTLYTGAHAGVSSEGPGASRFGSFYGASASPIPFLLYPEVKFMEAEAAFPTDKTRAANAYNAAVKASLAMFGVSNTQYEAENASETDATITMEKIMTQKYIALYTMPETFNDWRRTGMPDLQPAAGQTQIARRWPVAQDVRLYNNANFQPYAGVTPFDRVFWDQ